jgi:hypothetical protein
MSMLNRSRLMEQESLSVLELGDWTGLKRRASKLGIRKVRRVIRLNRGVDLLLKLCSCCIQCCLRGVRKRRGGDVPQGNETLDGDILGRHN